MELSHFLQTYFVQRVELLSSAHDLKRQLPAPTPCKAPSSQRHIRFSSSSPTSKLLYSVRTIQCIRLPPHANTKATPERHICFSSGPATSRPLVLSQHYYVELTPHVSTKTPERHTGFSLSLAGYCQPAFSVRTIIYGSLYPHINTKISERHTGFSSTPVASKPLSQF